MTVVVMYVWMGGRCLLVRGKGSWEVSFMLNCWGMLNYDLVFVRLNNQPGNGRSADSHEKGMSTIRGAQATTLKYKIISWNARGMNNMIKGYRVFSQLNRRGIHSGMLQEAHLAYKEGQALQKKWCSQLYYTIYPA